MVFMQVSEDQLAQASSYEGECPFRQLASQRIDSHVSTAAYSPSSRPDNGHKLLAVPAKSPTLPTPENQNKQRGVRRPSSRLRTTTEDTTADAGTLTINRERLAAARPPVKSGTEITDEGCPSVVAAPLPLPNGTDTPISSATKQPQDIKTESRNVRPVALPEFAGPDAAVLEALVRFGRKYWPEKNLEQFRPAGVVSWTVFEELAQDLAKAELYNYSHDIDVMPWAARDIPPSCYGTIWVPRASDMSSHEPAQSPFSIAVVDLQKRCFTSWNMDTHLHSKGKEGYEKTLGYDLVGVQNKLPDVSDNMSAFICLNAVREHCTGLGSDDVDNVSIRLSYLRRLLVSLVETNKADTSYPRHSRPFNTSLTARYSTATSSSLKRRAEDSAHDSEAGQPPLKKKDVAPTTELLAKQLTNESAIDRMRRHLKSCKNDDCSLVLDEHVKQGKQGNDGNGTLLDIADSLETKSSAFRKVVAMILRTHAIRVLAESAHGPHRLDKCKDARDLQLPTSVIDEMYPQLRKKKTPVAFRRWLTLTRKLEKLGDYLPFLPHGTGTPVTFREYERLSNEHLQQLLTYLDNDPVGQRVAAAGRAFRNHILHRGEQTFVWETMTDDELARLPSSELLDLIPKTIDEPVCSNVISHVEDVQAVVDEAEDYIEQIARQSFSGSCESEYLDVWSLVTRTYTPYTTYTSNDSLVLEAGADPNVDVSRQFHRSSALASASWSWEHCPAMVQLLMARGAHLDSENPEGLTALDVAAVVDDAACARVLVESGADMYARSAGTGLTAFEAAIQHNSHDVLRYFIEQSGGYGPDSLIEYMLEHGDAETQAIYS